MKPIAVNIVAIFVTTLLSFGIANASDNLIGLWASGAEEILSISKDGDALQAEFIRVNVKSEFERVRFPAKIEDGALVISSEQGNLSAKYDDDSKLLILGKIKAFKKLSNSQAQLMIESLENSK